MTISELKKLIEDEVSAAVSEPLMEPQVERPKRPRYRPVLQNEEDIDLALFYGGKKPDDLD
jgi:hypothetical protein